MKKILPHPPREENPTMWRSLSEKNNDPAFEEKLMREFPDGASEYEDSGYSRRDFLRLMGASVALAGAGSLAACRRPEMYLVPFTNSVEWTIPGKFLYYATSLPSRVGAMPLVVATVDGRPVKIEGNPLHPKSNGGTDGFAQASVLDLYDPHRSKNFVHEGKQSDEAAFTAALAKLREEHLANQGAGLAFLVDGVLSPSREALRAEITRQFPKALWCSYEPLDRRQAAAADAAVFGPSTKLDFHFDRADVILALDCDFLNCSETGVGFAQGFYARRNPDQSGAPMNRLYAVENHYSLTGGMADHRLRIKASEIPAFTLALATEIARLTGNADLSALVGAAPKFEGKIDSEWVTACAEDLVAHNGRGIVLAGVQQPEAVHVLVHGINAALGNLNSTITGASRQPAEPALTLPQLADAMRGGQVQTLFILQSNPVYTAPADLDFASLLEAVPNSIHLGLFEDETSRKCTWHVPAAHYLESWGDARGIDGTYMAVQPMILPLYDGWTELDLLSVVAGREKPEGPALVRETFFKEARPNSDDPEMAWNEFLRLGFLPGSQSPQAPLLLNITAASAILQRAEVPKTDGFELVFLQSSSVDDGRYAGNSWLQETPDFVTKLTWDNAALLSPATARKLGVKDGDMVKISAGNTSVEIAALIAPGHADDSVSVALGYGRKGLSHIMDNAGFDIYPLRLSTTPRFRTGVDVAKTKGTYLFSITQEHQSMEGRDFAREGTLQRYKDNPGFAEKMGMDSHLPPDISLYTNPPLTAPEQWAMTVDLNTCIGCNACLVACQAENNVPVVGKEQVRRGRDMAWIRIDRWFAGDEENPEMLAQAVMCQQCENAPCETVCPVNATVHSEDGLNLMAYNRCIGTRYCANNCPWKVRRFNFFDYNQRPLDKLYFGPLAKKGMADSLKMSKNPNVTVRMRGVMEKCTFCIQRIEEAKISRLVQAGPTNSLETPVPEFKTACQQACPSDSIVFGNEKDPNSRVARLRKDPRGYVTLRYLNTRPRVTYLARIKNPNMKMPGAAKVGHINTEDHHHHHDNGHGKNGEHYPTGSNAHGAEGGVPAGVSTPSHNH